MKKLTSLLSEINYSVQNNADISDIGIADLAYHTEKAGQSILFVCLEGARFDGHDFIQTAYEKGTRIFLCSHPVTAPDDAVILLVNDTRKALALLSAAFFDHPERKMRIIGITGTKGKSSTCAMICHVLNSNGIPTGSIGTYGAYVGNRMEETQNSTPESYELYRLFSQMLACGQHTVVMEVSSQSIFQSRIYGIHFYACIMTNLTPDHIGKTEHPDFEHYKNCKKSLFRFCDYAILNRDFPYFEEFGKASTGTLLTYSTKEKADFFAKAIEKKTIDSHFGVSFDIYSKEEMTPALVPMPGQYSVSNTLAACAVCHLCGVTLSSFAKAISHVKVPGRFEYIETQEKDVSYIIDYAHTGESLKNVLSAIAEYNPKRIICVFGSVGNRTELRRKELGKAAMQYADISVLTADNPNFENPELIINEIASVMPHDKYIVIPDRKKAIEYAVQTAESGDIVLLAGKGHEAYQLIRGEKIPFSEKEILQKAVEDKMKLCK